MSDVVKEKPVGEWLVECANNDSNNRLAEALAAQGFGYDCLGKNEQVLCHDGKERPMFCIPGAFVRRMIRAKKGSDVLGFRFWKRAHRDVSAYPMDFIERVGQVERSVKFKSGAAKLKAIKQAKAAKSS